MSDFKHTFLIDILNSIELLLVVLSILMCFSTGYIAIESQLLHKNFMRLYKCPDNIFLEQGQKALLNAGFLGWLQAIRFAVIIYACGCMAFMCIERIVATINLKTYETWTNNGISIIFFISHLILGSIVNFIFFSDVFPAKFIAVASLLIICLALPSLILLKRYNTIVYKRSKRIGSNYTLSQKFQISENIRTIRILWRTMMLTIPFGFIIVGTLAIILFYDDMFIKRTAFTIMNYTIAIYISIAQFMFVVSLPNWKLSVQSKLISLKKFIYPSRISSELEVKMERERFRSLETLDGHKMIISVEKEVDVYFRQLNKEWN